MKKLSLLLLCTALALAAGADRFSGSMGSVIKIEGTSTMHAWTMEGTTIKGEINAPTPDNWNAPAKAAVAIPVTSIKSEHSKMDKLMAAALKADKNPEICYEMTSATPKNVTASSFVLQTRGKLTIAGVTRDLNLDVQGSRNADGRYVLVGSAPLKMTAFGIKPPTAMLNTIKTGDDVKVTFRWVVEKAK
jgi:polyisoprenoid-binding protein YceI